MADLQLNFGLARDADHLFDGFCRMIGPVARMCRKELARASGFARERGQLFFG